LLAFLMVLANCLHFSGEARILKRGMRGTDVYALQELLADLGYVLAVDGIFGSETESLIKGIQKATGLKDDGIVGPETGEMLNRLRESIVAYTVQKGDNLTKLARRYDTTVSNITSYNGLQNPDRLLPGQVLYIPTGSIAALSRAADQRLRMQWPVKGRVSSGYGWRIHPILKNRHFHGGIDIVAPEGTPVKAAASGKVAEVGNRGNYGLAVVLEHSGGVTTWYGHNSKVLVRVGDHVKQGQTIALVGRTGLTTGPHLDFRIKIGDQTVDPLDWLP
jgi:murein DD-endopeptidase MepM/ murein hydrolase activator NlpD